ncbi:Ankyrin repeat protein, partial [Globisporangium splendens]
MDYAADHDDLEMLKSLQAHSADGCSRHAMDNAARRGNLEILQWLHENRAEGCTGSTPTDKKSAATPHYTLQLSEGTPTW